MPIKRDVHGVPMQLLILGDSEHAETLAISESLQAHGLSVRARLDRLNG